MNQTSDDPTFQEILAGDPTFQEILADDPTFQEILAGERIRSLPLVIFLGLLAIVGLTGNTIVCYIYGTKLKTSNAKCFIVFLAVIDLASCCVVIPTEIGLVSFTYIWTSVWGCKLPRLMSSATTVASATILCAIAVDRYRKVCHSLKWQIRTKVARILCGGSVLLAFLVSWPTLVIYGTKTLHVGNVTGHTCSVDDEYVMTVFPLIHNLCQLLLWISGLFTLTVLYILIWRKATRSISLRRPTLSDSTVSEMELDASSPRYRVENTLRTIEERPDLTCIGDNESGEDDVFIKSEEKQLPGQILTGTDMSVKHGSSLIRSFSLSRNHSLNSSKRDQQKQNKNTENGSQNGLGHHGHRKTSLSECDKGHTNGRKCERHDSRRLSFVWKSEAAHIKRQSRVRRTTFLMFMISLVWVISFLPYLILVITRNLWKDFETSLDDTGNALYKFFRRTYFVNCAANPIIYSVHDRQFRAACKQLFTNTCSSFRCNFRKKSIGKD